MSEGELYKKIRLPLKVLDRNTQDIFVGNNTPENHNDYNYKIKNPQVPLIQYGHGYWKGYHEALVDVEQLLDEAKRDFEKPAEEIKKESGIEKKLEEKQ